MGLQEALMDRVLMRVMILKEDVEYSRFKTKPFQLLMVTPEDYEGSGQQKQHQQQQQHVSSSGSSTGAAAAAPLQQQQSVLRQAQPPLLQLQPSQPQVPTLSLQLPVRRSSTNSSAGAAAAAAAAAEQGQPPSIDKDLVSRTQSAAGAVAVAAAARVSAAASALAAHMTNPQQLWHEKRGSTSGFSECPASFCFLSNIFSARLCLLAACLYACNMCGDSSSLYCAVAATQIQEAPDTAVLQVTPMFSKRPT
jgi:hypothetical protein